MDKEPEEVPDLEVLCKDVSDFIHSDEELLREIRQHIENTELMYSLKAENKTDTIRTLVAKIKILWEKYCE